MNSPYHFLQAVQNKCATVEAGPVDWFAGHQLGAPSQGVFFP